MFCLTETLNLNGAANINKTTPLGQLGGFACGSDSDILFEYVSQILSNLNLNLDLNCLKPNLFQIESDSMSVLGINIISFGQF